MYDKGNFLFLKDGCTSLQYSKISPLDIELEDIPEGIHTVFERWCISPVIPSVPLTSTELYTVDLVRNNWVKIFIRFFSEEKWLKRGHRLANRPDVKRWKSRGRYLYALWSLTFRVYDILTDGEPETAEGLRYSCAIEHFGELVCELFEQDVKQCLANWTKQQWVRDGQTQAKLLNSGKNPYDESTQPARYNLIAMAMMLRQSNNDFIDINDDWDLYRESISKWTEAISRGDERDLQSLVVTPQGVEARKTGKTTTRIYPQPQKYLKQSRKKQNYR